MIHYIHEFKCIHSENIVISVNHINDLKSISFLDIQDSILNDVKRNLKEKESCLKEYFLWGRKYKKLFVLIEADNDYEKRVTLYGKYFPTLPDSICIAWRDTENKIDLLEVSTLSRLWETPASDLTPEIFANKVKKIKFKNTKVKVFSYKDIQKKWLWLIEGVGKWSENKPCMVILEHIIDKKNPIQWIVWKGITFDTGGNQIKPWDYMYEMKGDMWWAAVVLGLMKEIDRYSVKKNIVACLCLAENVISNNAYKPSDILTWYTGKTVEIIHTDAEGRLVLADGISYLWKNYNTQKMMSVATLTGAVMVALGFRYAGIMGDDRQTIDKLVEYSKTHTEKYVELPLDEYMKEKTKSKIADYNNLDRSVHAGASMWAAFLSNFLENDEKYVHIDIAGAYINDGEPYGKMPKWMTWFWVESLSDIFLSK